MTSCSDADQSLSALFFSCLQDLQPSLVEAMRLDASLLTSIHLSTALLLVKLAHRVPLTATAPPPMAPSSSFDLDNTDAHRVAKEKEDAEARATVTDIVSAMRTSNFSAFIATTADGVPTAAGQPPHTALLARLAAALTPSREDGTVPPQATTLVKGLDTDLAVLVVLSALWLASKFWLPAIQRLSLASVFLHMSESLHTQTDLGGLAPTVEEVMATDLLGPPPMDDDVDGGLVVGSALRFESSDLRGGSSSDWIPTAAEAVEAIEMLLLRCSEYTIPLEAVAC